MEHLVKQWSLIFIKMFDKSAYTPLKLEDVFAVGTLIKQLDSHPGVEE